MKKFYSLIFFLLLAFHTPSLAFFKYTKLSSALEVTSVNTIGITGNLSICLPGINTTQLTGTGTPNAVNPWTSSNTGVATVNNTGLVTAVNYGSTTITYLDNLGNSASAVVYVGAFPTITSSSGSYSTCESGTLQLNGSAFPAATTPWESSNTAIAMVDNNGLVTGVASGVCSITYTNSGGCKATQTITINPLRAATITCGTSTSSQKTFDWHAVLGGNSYMIAYTINGGPLIFGTTGNILTYTVSGVSQTDKVEIYVTPNGAAGNCFALSSLSCQGVPCPTAGADGTITVCEDNTVVIDLATVIVGQSSGGIWTRTSGAGGVFNANAGTFMPGGASSTFSYTITGVTPCTTSVSNATVTVIPQSNAGTLAGNQNICVGSTTSFTSTMTGGTWSTPNTNIATVNAASGLVTAVNAGTSIMTYTVSGSGICPDATATRSVTVTAPPSGGTLAGVQNICIGFTSSFTSTVTGGVWATSNPAVATVNGVTGLVTGMSAGTATITYTVFGTGGCANVSVARTVVVNAASVGTLSGVQNICINQTTTFSSTVTGGTWSTPNTNIATVNPASGVVSGVGAGTAIIAYTVAAAGVCPNSTATRTITVDPAVSSTLFCDPSGVISPNAVAVDWNAIPGATNYEYSYSIGGGPSITGATQVSHYEIVGVLSGQSVTFILTNAVGVSCFQSTFTTCSNLAGVSFQAEAFQSFPNPVKNILNLTNAEPINNVTIVNAFGQQILNKSYDSKSIRVDMSGLMAGIYIVKVSSGTTTKTIKIIKE